MILFAVYAVIIWYLAMRFRRRWQAFVIVPAASAAVLLLVQLLQLISVADVGMYLLLNAEAAVILAVGLFIAILPRPPAHRHCPYCHYDTRGLPDAAPVSPGSDAGSLAGQLCPECGMPIDGYASVRRQRAKVFAGARNVQPVNGRDIAAEVRAMAEASRLQKAAVEGTGVPDRARATE